MCSFISVNDELANELFGSTLNELQEIYTEEEEDEINFEVTAQDLFGVGLNELFAAENEVVTSNDQPINWDAPANEIVEYINLLEGGDDQESDFEGEETNETLTGIKNVYEALDSVMGLKMFFMQKGYGGDFMSTVSKLEILLGKKVIICGQTAE